MEDKLYKISEIAKKKLLGLGEASIRRLIIAGDLKAINITQNKQKNSWRVSESEIKRFLAERAI